MPHASRRTEQEWHRKQAVSLFNHVWRLLEKAKRTPDEDEEMIHEAHASRYHWGVVGKPVRVAIADWQVSHVYAVLRRAEPATYHARRSLAVCRENQIHDFPLAFAYEALARAAAIAGKSRDRDRFVHRARVAADGIKEKEDRELLLSDLATIPRARRRSAAR